ncbi:cation diffusion facilitator family transporter [Haloactinopolyspora alba]|uniref:Cation diffusion facilitator family transporter n=1 Tax=Haloactinopolyspora alba TaxID=648780 RepID=A0A2P8D3A9_9ACTN|nr:cation diffusion facilitator family transporter [Haloactinopolyspora alba]PSK91701.1 cation diffusion facilitator family transporter [Haloactinopolyspora alba]
MASSGGTKAVLAALLANMGIAVTKFVAWALTGASSMLAEAIHSLADSGNQVLLLVGGRRAQRKATPEHPFGYGRVRYVFAFIVSIVLFSVGGLFALYEAFHKYEEVHAGHPNELLESRWWWVPVVVLVAAIVMETFSFRTAIIESDKVRGNRSWVQFVRRAKSPELPVILLEDLGALVGLVFALAGVGLSLVTDNAYFDVAGTAAIGVLLVVIAVVLAVEMSSLLIGEGAVQEKVDAMVAALHDVDGVDRVIHIRTLYVGPEELLVAAKIAVRADQGGDSIAAAIDGAEARIREAVPEAVHIYLEPDLDRPVAAPET